MLTSRYPPSLLGAFQLDRAGIAIGTDLLILCYHAVSSTWSSPLAVDPLRLGAQVRFLLRRGYVPRTLSEALEEPLKSRTLVVTFDDAYRSVLSKGYPVLGRLGVPATVFVPTDLADEGGQITDLINIPAHWVGAEDEMRGMSWEELRRLAADGWEIGSHTCSHPHLTRLGSGEASTELRTSREVCENQLQRPCKALAYPFGSYDRRVMGLAGTEGYRLAVTLEQHVLDPLFGRGLLDLPREGIYPSTGWPKFLINTSRIVRRVRISKSYSVVATRWLWPPEPRQ